MGSLVLIEKTGRGAVTLRSIELDAQTGSSAWEFAKIWL